MTTPVTAIHVLSEDLNPSSCRLIDRPQTLWVFGGPRHKVEEERLANPASLRDFFLAKVKEQFPPYKWAKGVTYPENFQDWYALSGYSDLHEFERDACFIARGVIVFLESEGALAEIGALAIDESLAERVFLVLHEKYHRNISYLWLGPITRIKNSKGQICVIGTEPNKKMDEVEYISIIDHINDWDNSLDKGEIINHRNPGHVILLIADLINILLVSKDSDLLNIVPVFGIKIDQTQLRKYTSLLNFFDLITIKERGTEVFYTFNRKNQKDWINYQAKRDKPGFDRIRIKAMRMEEIKKNARQNSILEQVHGQIR